MNALLEGPITNALEPPPLASILSAFDSFQEIWVIDFEFGQDSNLLPEVTPFMAFGGHIHIEMPDENGDTIFGAIDQVVERYEGP